VLQRAAIGKLLAPAATNVLLNAQLPALPE